MVSFIVRNCIESTRSSTWARDQPARQARQGHVVFGSTLKYSSSLHGWVWSEGVQLIYPMSISKPSSGIYIRSCSSAWAAIQETHNTRLLQLLNPLDQTISHIFCWSCGPECHLFFPCATVSTLYLNGQAFRFWDGLFFHNLVNLSEKGFSQRWLSEGLCLLLHHVPDTPLSSSWLQSCSTSLSRVVRWLMLP